MPDILSTKTTSPARQYVFASGMVGLRDIWNTVSPATDPIVVMQLQQKMDSTDVLYLT